MRARWGVWEGIGENDVTILSQKMKEIIKIGGEP